MVISGPSGRKGYFSSYAKVLLNKKFYKLLFLGVFILIVGSMLVGWGYTHPEEQAITETTTLYEYEVDFDTSAVASNTTALYEEDEEVKNSKYYQSEAFPDLNVAVDFRLKKAGSSDNTSLRINYTMRAWQQADLFWERNIHSDSIETYQTHEYTLHVGKLNARRDSIIRGTNRQTEVSLVIDLGLLKDQEVVSNETVIIGLGDNLYTVNHDYKTISMEQQVQRVVGTKTVRPDYMYYSVGIIALGLLIIVIVLMGSRYKADKKDIWNYEMYTGRELIKDGNIRERSMSTTIQMNSVSELKEMALEKGSRMIYDSNKKVICLIDDETCYYVSHPDYDAELY